MASCKESLRFLSKIKHVVTSYILVAKVSGVIPSHGFHHERERESDVFVENYNSHKGDLTILGQFSL